MLTDKALQNLKPEAKAYKVTDRDGMYVVVSPKGTISFRLDYRHQGKRETLTIGPYGKSGAGLTLSEARAKADEARRLLRDGISPARAKAEAKKRPDTVESTVTFRAHAATWLRDAGMAESTKAMRGYILNRDILPVFGDRPMEGIKTAEVLSLCERIKARGAPAPAVQAREIIALVYRHANKRGLGLDNPADAIAPSAIATFKPRDRAMTPAEVGLFFRALDTVATLPTLRLAVRFMLMTMVRKSEFVLATWDEIDFDQAVWTIPAARMKAGRPHNVYLSQQALDILVALKTCAGDSPYLHPSRYRADQPLSAATLNRVVDATVERIRADGKAFGDLSVHDMRRTASTLLHEAGFNSDWIEKCLAHEQKGVRAVYNKAEFAQQRREMLQQWADMIDGWVKGADVVPLGSKRQAAA